MSTLQEILDNLDANAPLTLLEIIREEVSAWMASDERKRMLEGKRYYRVKNDILDRRRQTIGDDGRLVDVHNLADNRIPHGFVRKLVDQKTGYLLARPFVVKTEDKAYQDELDSYFDKSFKRMMKNIGKDAINCGKGWLQVYYDEAGELSFMRLPTEECIPIWRDAAHTELAAFIRVYEVETYVAKTKRVIRRIQWWDQDGMKLFEDDGQLKLIEEAAHFSYIDGENVQAMTWERLPFICFKYNDEEQPLLDLIKQQIDDYDRRKSDNSNNLEDLPNSIYVVNNFDGTGAAEFRKNIALYRVAFVDNEGGVDTISLTIDTEAYKNHMDELRKNIYEFGRGVDTQRQEMGNASGIALKFLYADLDMDMNDMESEFQAALEQLLWFVDTHIGNTGGDDYSEKDVEIIFNRDIVINETEAVTNAKNSVGVISNRTIVANHPWTTNTDDELKQVEEEKEAASADLAAYGGLSPNAPEGPEESGDGE
ncbi:phage portal protein [Paenibacillus kribbensis]|uniref:phage portal protein n=1 Tax=Paenibacillus kribbensis TaxID=172713 RepID=UPI002DB71ABB|nr:phage portal protein [Paenibacillus kribbensis]MEC0234447.1 phage portal protein [Paenibacillus kribbensis]